VDASDPDALEVRLQLAILGLESVPRA